MKRYLIAVAFAVFIIVGMFLLEQHMRTLANEWAELGVAIPLHDRILLGVAALWGTWGVLLSPVILAACIGIAVVTDLLKPQPR
jgi:hypothetical protein